MMDGMSRPKPSAFVVPIVLLLAAFAAFGRSLFQGYAPIDDALLIYNNVLAHGPTWAHLKAAFTTFDPELYIPLTFVSFQLNYLVSGLDPVLYHLTNILIHAINAWLVFYIMKKLSGEKIVAQICALIFAVHPLNSEAVVWLAGRKDLLSTLFFLLSFLFYIKYRAEGWKTYAWSVVFFAFALLAKVTPATLPAVLILYDLLLEKRKTDRQFFLDKLPYALLSALFLGIAVFGKERILANAPLADTILMATKSTTFYLQKYLLPVGLHPLHTFEGPIRLFSVDFLPHTLIVLALIGATIWCWKRFPWISFALAYFFVTLAPTYFNFHKGDITALAVERYAYLPFLGALMLVSIPVGMAVTFFSTTKDRQSAGIGIAVGLIALLIMTSFVQTKMWDDERVFHERALALDPSSTYARVEMARYERQTGNTRKAFEILKAGLAYRDHWRLHEEAGYLYAETGDTASAREQFVVAGQMVPDNPEPVFDLASLSEQTGDRVSALPLYEKAVGMDPSFVVARVALGKIYANAKRNAEAETQFREAVKWNPNSFEAHMELARLLITEGKKKEAHELLNKASEIDPSSEDVTKLLQQTL